MINGISKITAAVKNNTVATLSTCVILIAGITTATNAQTTELNKHDAVQKMATSQYWDVTSKSSKKHAAVKSNESNISTTAPINGEDKYLKTTQAGKRYSEFQVFDINKMDNHQVAMGLLTNSLDRDTRYDEKGDVAAKTNVTATAALTQISAAASVTAPATIQIPVSIATSMDKHFVILAGNDYRYMDGKKLVGNQTIVNGLAKGKPISETTFFYGLQKAGIVSAKMTITQFTNMNASEKQNIMNSGAIAGNL